jgi:hypothetical protein
MRDSIAVCYVFLCPSISGFEYGDWSQQNLIWTSCHWMPPQCKSLLIPCISNNNMADMRTRNTGASLPLLTLGFLCDVWWMVPQIYATSLREYFCGCKIIWQLCNGGLALGLMVITSEPLEIAVLNFVQRRAISITTHNVYSFCVSDY